MTPEARRRLALLVVWLLSLALRVLFLAGMNPSETLRADAFTYSVLASNLVNHETYSEAVTPPFQPYVHKPPGYPVMLAPFFAGRDLLTGAAAAMRAQVVVGSLLPPLVVVLGLRILPAPLAVVAGLLTAACPVLVTTPSFLTTEAGFSVLLVVALLLSAPLLRHGTRRRALVAGLCWGLMALVRSAAVLLPVGVALHLYHRGLDGGRRRAALALLLACGILVVPWSIRDRVVGWNATAPGYLTEAFAQSIYPDLRFGDSARGYAWLADPSYARFAASVSATLAEVWARARQDPWPYVQWFVVGKWVTLWEFDMVQSPAVHIYPVAHGLFRTAELNPARVDEPLAGFYRGFRGAYPVVVALVLLGAMLALQRRPRGAAVESERTVELLYVVLACNVVTYGLTMPEPRYMIPMRPLLYLLALDTLRRLWLELPVVLRRRAVVLVPVTLAAGLGVYVLLATSIVSDLAAIWTWRGTDYAGARTRVAFAGLPVDHVRDVLDATLPPEAGVALAPSVLADLFLHERLGEGLYPRRIDRRSAYALELRPPGAPPDPEAQELAPYGSSTLAFRGPPLVSGSPGAPSAPSGTWLHFLAATCSAGGFGLLVVALAGIAVPDPLLAPGAAMLAGILTVGVSTSGATWLGLPLVGVPLGVAGIVAGVAAVAGRRRRIRWSPAAFGSRAGVAARRAENWVLGAVLLAVLVRMATVPVALWDGRSTWLLQAHQLRQIGRLAPGDALRPDYQGWTHPGYPLLFPAWLAHFTAFSGGWDERAAALAIAVLLAAVLPLDWALARARLGRWLGGALVASVFCSVGYLTMGGYADGWLTLLLLLELLALADPATERLGWLAAMVVSLLKWEGWVLGVSIALACTFVFPYLRTRRAAARWVPFCVFAVGLLHVAWDLLHGVPTYTDTPWHLAVEQWPSRLHAVLAETWDLLRVDGYTRCHALVWVGLVGAVGAVTLGPRNRFSVLALGLAALSTVFALAVLTLSPFDPWWHASTAADRLLLPAAALALLGGLETVAAAVREAEPSPPAGVSAPAVPPRRAQQVALAFLTALLLTNVYRAATQSIVHDEALTYNWFVAGPPVPPPDMNPNDHVLNTELARHAVALFGPSELSLRLPSLLGGALSFGAFFVLARDVFASGPWFLLAIALLSLNPFLLDLMCAARGYGLALGCVLWAMVLMVRATHAFPATWLVVGASVLLGLSVSASLAFVSVAASLAVLFAAMVLADAAMAPSGLTPRRLALHLVAWLALPGPLLATILSWPLLRGFDRSQLYAGWSALGDSVEELVASSIFHAAMSISSASDLVKSPEALLGPGTWRAALVRLAAHVALPIASVAASGAVIALAVQARRQGGFGRLRVADRLAVLCAGACVLTLLLEIVLNGWSAVKYPPDRAAIWMVPLWTLTALLLLSRASDARAGWQRAVGWLGAAGGLVVLGSYLANFQVSYFKTWRYDAGTKAFWERIAAASNGRGAAPLRVGGQWMFEPSVNFYRRVAPAGPVLPFQRLADPDPMQFDYFVFNPVDFPHLDMSRLTVVAEEPGSGVRLVAPRGP